jgi:hypothetical protein
MSGELTDLEKAALSISAELMNACVAIVTENVEQHPDAERVPRDLGEVSVAIHNIQGAVIRSAAARANPGLVRPLGIGFTEEPS